MALTAKQKQKKLEKKNKKRKLKKSSAVGTKLNGKASDYAKFPIHECIVPNSLFEIGIGNILVSRRLPDGSIALSAFVVDVFCLGVKNAFFKLSSEFEYEHTIKAQLIQAHNDQSFENLHPSCSRKLIEGAVRYAKDLGFSPHSDYKKAKGIFGDFDDSVCPVKYTYGQDGKPLYIRGPNESTVQAKRIVDQLHKKCGEGNYNFIVSNDDDMLEIM